MSSWFERFVEPSMEITPETNPVMMMRRNQRLHPVPEKFKTSGQYYHHFLEGLTGEVRAAPLCAVRPIRERESEFHSFLGNIRYAAACVIQKYYLRYKRHWKLRTIYFNTARHNDVNYYSVPATSRVDPVVMRLNHYCIQFRGVQYIRSVLCLHMMSWQMNLTRRVLKAVVKRKRQKTDSGVLSCIWKHQVCCRLYYRKYYRYKRKRKLRNWNHFKAVPHNG